MAAHVKLASDMQAWSPLGASAVVLSIEGGFFSAVRMAVFTWGENEQKIGRD